MQIPKEVYSMSDLSKRQMIINQLSNQHKTYTLFTNGNECAFSTTGIDNNVIKLKEVAHTIQIQQIIRK